MILNSTRTLVNGTSNVLNHTYVTQIHNITVINGTENILHVFNTDEFTFNQGNTGVQASITLINGSHDGNATKISYSYRNADSLVQTNVTREGMSGALNASGFLDTIGTLVGVAALIFVIVGAFYMSRKY